SATCARAPPPPLMVAVNSVVPTLYGPRSVGGTISWALDAARVTAMPPSEAAVHPATRLANDRTSGSRCVARDFIGLLRCSVPPRLGVALPSDSTVRSSRAESQGRVGAPVRKVRR